MLFICYPKCSTCLKAKKFLDDNNLKYELRDIKVNNPKKDEIKKWLDISKLPIKSFFNTSGLLYKSLNLKDKLDTISDDEKIELLASDGMLIKRPILIKDDFVLLGFKEDKWKEIL